LTTSPSVWAPSDKTHLQVITRVQADYRLEFVPLDLRERKLPVSLRSDICGTAQECRPHLYLHKSIGIPFSKSGGLPFGRLLGHLGKEGHYEITLAAAGKSPFEFKMPSLAILADASRDADFIEWTNPAAHAQTQNDNAGKIQGTTAENQQRFVDWVTDKMSKAAKACSQGNYSGALYLVGYSLHGVQDLAFHEGITNAEHSYSDNVEDKHIDSKERYNEKFDLAIDLSHKLLSRFSESMPAGCWEQIRSGKQVGSLGTAKRSWLIGPGKYDFTYESYREYQDLAALVRAALDRQEEESAYFVNQRWLDERDRSGSAMRLLGTVRKPNGP
jgi:hypothetical protein